MWCSDVNRSIDEPHTQNVEKMKSGERNRHLMICFAEVICFVSSMILAVRMVATSQGKGSCRERWCEVGLGC